MAKIAEPSDNHADNHVEFSSDGCSVYVRVEVERLNYEFSKDGNGEIDLLLNVLSYRLNLAIEEVRLAHRWAAPDAIANLYCERHKKFAGKYTTVPDDEDIDDDIPF